MSWRIRNRRRSSRVPKLKYVRLAVTVFEKQDGTYGAVLDPRHKQFGIRASIIKADVNNCEVNHLKYALTNDPDCGDIWRYIPICDPAWHNAVRAHNHAPALTAEEIADNLKRPILLFLPNQIVRHKGQRKLAL